MRADEFQSHPHLLLIRLWSARSVPACLQQAHRHPGCSEGIIVEDTDLAEVGQPGLPVRIDPDVALVDTPVFSPG